MHSLILLVAKVDKEIIGSVLVGLTRGEELIKWTGVEWIRRDLRDDGEENQCTELEK